MLVDDESSSSKLMPVVVVSSFDFLSRLLLNFSDDCGGGELFGLFGVVSLIVGVTAANCFASFFFGVNFFAISLAHDFLLAVDSALRLPRFLSAPRFLHT